MDRYLYVRWTGRINCVDSAPREPGFPVGGVNVLRGSSVSVSDQLSSLSGRARRPHGGGNNSQGPVARLGWKSLYLTK